MGKVVDALIEGTPLGKLAWEAVGVDAWWEIGVGKYIRESLIPIPNDDFGNEAMQQQQMLRSPTEARRSIYGKAMVSGPIVFVEYTGTDNEYLHLVIPLASHQCEEVVEIYFDDEVIYQGGSLDATYVDHARINIHLGKQTSADSQLQSECPNWTDKHIGHGITYLYVRLKHDPEFYSNGLPNIKALVQGKPVYDPRKDTSVGGVGSHRWNDDLTWEWSDTWALCVLDYTRFESGVGALASEIDLASYALAANDSDQLVEYDDEGNTEKRYSCNGTFTQSMTPASVLDKLLTAGAGMQTYLSGQYQLFSGVYQGPYVLTLTERDLAGEVEVRPFTTRAHLSNAVRGTFVDPENFYQPTDFTPYESEYYRAQDNDEYIDHDIDLPFTQSVYTAQRLAKLYLELNRAGQQIIVPLNMIGLSVSVGQVVELDLPRLGIKAEYQVMDWLFDFGQPIKVTLRETHPDLFVYDKGSYTERKLTPVLNLPSSKRVPTVSGVVWTPMGDDANWQGLLTWNAPGGNSAYRYRLEVSDSFNVVVYQDTIDGTRLHIPKLDAGNYTVTLWAVNLFANRSNVPVTMVIGADAPPSVVGVQVDAGALELTLRPQTAVVTAATTEFEVKGGLSSDIVSSIFIGKGKEVIWPSRYANTQYFVWARATNNYGKSAWFGPVLAQTSDDPTAIINLIENEIGARLGAYTWFAWADDDEGAGFTTDKSLSGGKAYMGVANEKSVATPSGNYQDYAWSRIAADIGSIFTPEEEAQLDNLMAGKLPGGSKDLLALQDALNNNSLSNDLLDANKLLNQGINAHSLGGETPAGAQNKADAAKSSAISTSANDATTKANNAQNIAQANAALDALNKANLAENNAISTAASDASSKATSAQSAAESYALAKANLAEITAKAYADGKVSNEEARAIADAQAKADAAQSVAIAVSVDIELVTTGHVVAIGRKVARTGTYQSDWTSQAYSKQSFTGGAVASCSIASGSTGSIRFMFGLNTDPTANASYNTIDYAFYPTNSSYHVYEGGTGRGVVLNTPPKVDDTLAVIYDGTQVKYLINGAVVRTVSAPTNLKLYMDSSFVNVPAGISGINLQPLSNLNDALVRASADAQAKANLAETTSKAYADGKVSNEEARAIVDAQAKADMAEFNANNLALLNLNNRITSAESEKVKNSLSASGLAHYQRLIVYGDSNKYYPVIIRGGSQNVNRNIKVWRGYYEQGPNDWYTSTHKGSLMMHWEGNFGGWGGAVYKSHLVQNTSAYTTLLADLFHCNHSMGFCFMLRGGGPGGALYHLGSDQALGATPYYNQDLYYDHSNNSYDSYAPAPASSLNYERLNSGLMGNVTVGNLIAYSGQFHSLKAKLASFGGLTAETIAALAISTNHLQANAVTADKLQVNTALIQRLIADQALFNQIQAQFGQFGGLAANAIAAKAITTEKLDVRARNLVNNFTATGETTGWSTKPLVNHSHNGQIIKAMQVRNSGNYQGLSDFFDIDHTKIYEVNFSIYRKSGGATGTRYFGMYATGGPDTNVENYNATTRTYISATTNFYFWSGDINTGTTRQMRCYIVGSDVDVAAVPDSLNVGLICKLRPGTKQVRLRALNYYNASVVTEDYWFNPSVTEVGGGVVSANQVLANSGLFNTLKAKIASFGGLTANELQVDSALITKLVGTSALFNQLTAQLATFGGLTANAIAADAIEGRHFKASQLIESPIIQGGEFRLVGTGFMKVMRATPFGPDALVEWYGPKLLTGTTPNYNALKKSNAITYLSADGDAYFGGTLSAGVFKNGGTVTVKTSYPSNSYPLTIGPFGTNGNSKTVVVSFYLLASYSSTNNSTNPAQPKLSWQLQRKIGSGGWSTISSGIFNGTTTVEYDQETNRYHSFEHLSGSSTTVDNSTSTIDFNYRVKVISQIRFHATQNIHNQNLTLLITEQ